MQTTRANDIEIAYETFGDPGGRPLVMIMGLVSQMIGWPDRFCWMLAEAGHFVVRFDNRDVGLSSKMEHLGKPDLDAVENVIRAGGTPKVPYTLRDMAADTWSLMDALGLSSANVCGISMGGMIAQVMAIEKPDRMRTMICLETTTGEPDLPPSTPEAAAALLSIPPAGREAYLDYIIDVFRAFSGGSPRFEPQMQREISGAAYDRMRYPEGFFRQMAAILAAPGRRRALGAVEVPTLVVHGDCDTVFPPAHGRDVADAVVQASLVVVKGLGHGMAYPGLWDEMVQAISGHTS
jgi:pimeloyl-ACP methyl ester carboxylesterase